MAEKPTSTLPTTCPFILALWIPVWVFFLLWPLRKDPATLANTLKLIPANTEARRASAYGQKFQTFLRFCKGRLPAAPRFVWLALTMRRSTRFGPFTFCIPVSLLNTLSLSWSTKRRPSTKTIPTPTLV